MRLRWLGSLAIGFVACVSESDTPIDLPSDVDWAAVVILDANDTLVAASPLTPRNALRLSVAAREDERTIVVGYRAEAIDTFAPLDRPGDRALVGGGNCTQRLPDPAWSIDVADRQGERNLPSLYVPWTLECPPSQAADFSFEFPPDRCGPPTLYRPRIEILDGACEATVHLEEVGGLEAFVQVDGSLCVDRLASSCPSEIHRRQSPPWAIVDEVDLVGALEFPPSTPIDSSVNVFNNVRTIHHVAVAGTRVLALLSATDEAEQDTCDPVEPSRLAVVDAESMALVQTSTLPPCTRMLATEPGTNNVLAVGLRADHHGFVVSRVDDRGTIRAQIEDPFAATADIVRISGAFVLPNPPRLVVTGGPMYGENARTEVRMFDLPTLRTIALAPMVATIGDTQLVRSAPIGSGAFLLANERGKHIIVVDFENEQVVLAEAREMGDFGLGASFSANRFLVPNLDRRAILEYVWERGASVPLPSVAYSFFDVSASPFMIEPWPGDSERALVIAMSAHFPPAVDLEADTFNTYVGLIDLEPGRVRPTSQRIGVGPVSNVAVDSQGRFWLGLGWMGKLVRLTAR